MNNLQRIGLLIGAYAVLATSAFPADKKDAYFAAKTLKRTGQKEALSESYGGGTTYMREASNVALNRIGFQSVALSYSEQNSKSGNSLTLMTFREDETGRAEMRLIVDGGKSATMDGKADMSITLKMTLLESLKFISDYARNGIDATVEELLAQSKTPTVEDQKIYDSAVNSPKILFGNR